MLASYAQGFMRRLGAPSASVLGYSQCGAVVQQLAIDHPEQCGRIVLACTYAFNTSSLREQIEGHIAPVLLRALGMKRFARLVFSVGLREVDDDTTRWLTALVGAQDRDRMVEAWREAMAFDSRDRRSDIRCPTLILAGSADTAVPAHHAKMLHDGIPGSRLVTIEGAGQGMIWTHRDRFEQALGEFLAEGASR